MITVLALLANIMLSSAYFLGNRGRNCDPLGVLLILLALWLLLVGCKVNWSARIQRASSRLAPQLLAGLVVLRLVIFGNFFISEAHAAGFPDLLSWLLLLSATVALASYRWGFLISPHVRFPVVLLVAVVSAILIIKFEHTPPIDVLIIQEEGSGFLLSGRNPYTSSYSSSYRHPSQTRQILDADGRIPVYPYPPLSLLAVLPGHILGDVRYASLLALAATSILLVVTTRRMGMKAGGTHELIAVALILQESNQFVIYFGWIEPFLALGVAACVYSLASGRSLALGLSLAWIVAVKQYGFLWTIPIVGTGRLRKKDLAIAAMAVAAVNVPFFILGPRRFWDGVISEHLGSPLRPDLLSVPALIYTWNGRTMTSAWAFIAAITAAVIVLRGWPIPAVRAILGGTAIVLAFTVFGTHGAPNFYWFASVSPLGAAVLDWGRSEDVGRQ